MSFEAVLRSFQSINKLSKSLIDWPAFAPVHVILPDPTQPEVGFIRAISWLYCLYFECGCASIGFFSRLSKARQPSSYESLRKHIEVVRSLRTELHHNLGSGDPDQQTRISAENWKRGACSTALPNTDAQWNICYTKLVEEAEGILRNLEDLVRELESDRLTSSGVLDDWCRCLERNWPAASFDELISDVATRTGCHELKVVSFRNRHIDRWRKELDLLEDGFDFKRQATLLIEKELLNDESSVIPVSGQDLMEELGVSPGIIVRKLLKEARSFFFSQDGCKKDDILAHLRQYLEKEKIDSIHDV